MLIIEFWVGTRLQSSQIHCRLIQILTYVRRRKHIVVSGITTPMAIVIGPLDVTGWSKLDVVPGGGISAGVGVASLVVVDIF